MKNTRKNFWLTILVSVVILIAVYLFASHFGENKGFSWGNFINSLEQERDSKTSPKQEAPEGMKEYHNDHYGFSLLYPDSLKVQEFPEEGDSMVVTFEYIDDKTVFGFQIFVVPFTEEKITDERFKTDIPSGVLEKLTGVTIDGAEGVTFYSENEILGPTAEVWFINGAYLYEVTTFKELDKWLAKIMYTWMFY